MGKIVRIWNLIHYCMFIMQLNFHKLFRYLNPVYYFRRSQMAKKWFSDNRGIDDIDSYIEKSTFNNSYSGTPIVWAGIHMGIMLAALECICFNLAQILTKNDLRNYFFQNKNHEAILIVALLIPPGILNHFLIFKDRLYLKYFKEFESIPNNRLILYCAIFALLYLFIVIITWISFTWFKFI